MKTSRDFLIHGLLDGSGKICKCCGKEVDVTVTEILHPLRYTTTIEKYECDCEAWNEIIKSKKEIEELNRKLQYEYNNYERKVKEITKGIHSKYNFDLSKEVWKKELKNIK